MPPPPPRSARRARWKIILLIVLLVFAAVVIAWGVIAALSPAPVTAPLAVDGWPTPAPIGTIPPETVAPGPRGERVAHTGGFSLLLPDGWRAENTTLEGSNVMLEKSAPDADASGDEYAAQVSVVVGPTTRPTTLDDEVRALKEDLAAFPSGYDLVDDARVSTESGVPGHILGGTFTESLEDLALRDKRILIVSPSGDAVYAISGQALASAWEEQGYNAVFDALFTSFEFAEPATGAAPDVEGVSVAPL